MAPVRSWKPPAAALPPASSPSCAATACPGTGLVVVMSFKKSTIINRGLRIILTLIVARALVEVVAEQSYSCNGRRKSWSVGSIFHGMFVDLRSCTHIYAELLSTSTRPSRIWPLLGRWAASRQSHPHRATPPRVRRFYTYVGMSTTDILIGWNHPIGRHPVP